MWITKMKEESICAADNRLLGVEEVESSGLFTINLWILGRITGEMEHWQR